MTEHNDAIGKTAMRLPLRPIVGISIAALPVMSARGGIDQSETLSVSFDAERMGGNAVGCFITFSAVVRDFADKRGAPVLLEGAAGIVQTGPRTLVPYVRLFPSDLLIDNQKVTGSQGFQPSYGYAQFGTTSTAGLPSVPNTCAASGGYCTGYPSDAVLVAVGGIRLSRSLTVTYQRYRGAMDVPVPINLAPGNRATEQALDEFGRCTAGLASQVLGR